jgi:hypothetical protein
MGRPRKANVLERRASVRLSAETYAAYEEVAQLVGVPAGQLMRQALALEAQELQALVAALLQSKLATRPFAEADGGRHLGHGGGLTQRLRRMLLDRQLEGLRGPLLYSTDLPDTL